VISGVALQIHFVDDVTIRRRSFPAGDVITITAHTVRGSTEIDLFVAATFDKQLTVNEVANEPA